MMKLEKRHISGYLPSAKINSAKLLSDIKYAKINSSKFVFLRPSTRKK